MEFKFPFTCIVSGPTRSGKTEFVKRLVRKANCYINPPPQQIIWSYGEWQQGYSDIQNVEFVQGLPDIDVLRENGETRKLLICDDLMQDYGSKNGELDALFCKGSHHWNLSVVHIVQNLFFKNLRTARINSHYLVLLKNPSDRLQVMTLARQLYPTNQKYFVQSFDDACSQKYGHLVLDLEPSTPDDMRLRSCIFDEVSYVYQPRV